MSLFILEIGSEELPARFLPTQEKELYNRFVASFDENAIAYGAIKVFSTPRRAVVMVEDIAPVQQEKEETISGPPVRVAYDANNNPTKALEGFLRTNDVSLEQVFTIETEKGPYIAVKKHMGGAKTAELLSSICPQIILGQPFAKKMRWGAYNITYARPLRWILALFDNDIVPFEVEHIKSNRLTWGHRIHTKSADNSIVLSVDTAANYLQIIRNQGGVEPMADLRRNMIIDEGNKQAHAVLGKVLWKDSLLDEVQGLCEHPVPLLGNIDESFLEVPREVLLTSMQSHQKSFGIEDERGNLLPHFLTVLNMTPPNKDIVQKGWERVLRARLEDARFFWRSDLTESLDNWLERLDSVIFIGPLGSMGDKTRRLSKLCAWLAKECAKSQVEHAARAGRLAKADLVSGMVGEFDTLQGIMGGIYAQKKGEDATVCTAIQEQYLPSGPDSPVPSSLLGALLSIADKADSLVGCFGLGMIPTGTADPHALRRAALGIARCVLEFGLRVNIQELFKYAHELYGQKAWKLEQEECLAKLDEFFAARLKNYWQGHGADTLLVDAVLNAGSNDVWASQKRLEALELLQKSDRYTEAVQTFKRVSNIVRKQGNEHNLDGNYKSELLQEDAEKSLALALDKSLPSFDKLWAEDSFDAIPQLLLDIRPAVDGFFDGVMVMCDDETLRINRLNMLKALLDRMNNFADFSALQV